MHGSKVCHRYWRVMNHAIYTVQMRRDCSSTRFLIETWRIMENLVTAENIPDRLTVLLCVHSDGSDKQVPRVIGKSQKPRCFNSVKKLPTKYHTNGKAWIRTEIF